MVWCAGGSLIFADGSSRRSVSRDAQLRAASDGLPKALRASAIIPRPKERSRILKKPSLAFGGDRAREGRCTGAYRKLLRLEQARQHALENPVHRNARLGLEVIVNDNWYNFVLKPRCAIDPREVLSFSSGATVDWNQREKLFFRQRPEASGPRKFSSIKSKSNISHSGLKYCHDPPLFF